MHVCRCPSECHRDVYVMDSGKHDQNRDDMERVLRGRADDRLEARTLGWIGGWIDG